MQSIGVMPVTYAGQVARGGKIWGEKLCECMNSYNHTAGINILGECLPSDNNFVELSDENEHAVCRKLLEEFGQITIVPHGEIFEITDRPACLKVKV